MGECKGGYVTRSMVSAVRFSRKQNAMQSIGRCCAIVLIAGSTACSAHSNNTQRETGFSCTVSGAKFADPTMDNAAVCQLVQSKIDAALTRRTVRIEPQVAAKSAQSISVDIRYTKLGSIIATIDEKSGGVSARYPEIAVDVSDKPIGRRDVNILAAEVARVIAEKRMKP
jgi:hypothetical protein